MTEPTKTDIQEVKDLIVGLAVRIENHTKAIRDDLGGIRVELADIRSVLDAQIREGEPHDEEDEGES